MTLPNLRTALANAATCARAEAALRGHLVYAIEHAELEQLTKWGATLDEIFETAAGESVTPKPKTLASKPDRRKRKRKGA